MTPREEAYAQWLAARRGCSFAEAVALARQPKPKPYRTAKPVDTTRSAEVIGLRPVEREPVWRAYRRRYGRAAD